MINRGRKSAPIIGCHRQEDSQVVGHSSRLRVWKRGQPLIEFHCKPGRYCCEIRWAVHIDPNVTSDAISIQRGTDKI